MDFTYVPMLLGMEHQVPMLSEIPVISALLGPVVGLAAARAVLTHFSVMVEGKSQLFVAGPPIVEQATAEKLSKDQLGGSSIHGKNGSIDNLCKSEEEAFQQIRKFLSYMPQNAWNLPSRLLENQRVDPPSRKEEALLHIIPIKRKATYNMREIIHLVVDKDSFFEIGESWGTAIIVGLARLNGYVVGILGSDCRRDAGVLTALGAQKLRRHVDLCNTFHIPVVSFVDQPGFAIGLEAEKQSTIRYGGSLIAALYLASVPWFTVIVRKAFGVGAAALVDRGGMRVSWPSGDWGSLPFEGGIQAAFKRQMESSDNPQAFYDAMMKRFEAVRNPIRTATAFGIEEIIDPRDTRPLLCDWIHLAYLKQSSEQISPKKGFYRP